MTVLTLLVIVNRLSYDFKHHTNIYIVFRDGQNVSQGFVAFSKLAIHLIPWSLRQALVEFKPRL